MKKFSRSAALLVCAALFTPGAGLARDVVEVNFNAAVREYCHVLRFPSGWQMPRQEVLPKFSLGYDYEFRVPGVLGTRFLVRGVEEIVRKYYTTNIYEADLSDPKGVAQPASEEAWNSAAVVPLKRNEVWLARGPTALSKYATFQGLQFIKSGDAWDLHETRLSPDPTLLVLQSWSGTLGPSAGSDVPGDFSVGFHFGRAHGKLFFDVYNAETAKKVITITASFVTILPAEAFGKTGFVTERYFITPIDEGRQRCLVCEFGRKR